MIEELRVAWHRAVGRHDSADEAFDELIRRYGEDHRRYHTVEHLHDVVSGVDFHHDLCSDAVTTVLAAFFHDAVYVIGAPDNEAASADLARSTLAGLGFERDAADRVARLVIATADHLLPAEETLRTDAAVLIDADLAVLAGDAAEYRRYVERVRAEYAEIPDDLWRAGRAAVLEAFLGREAIYFTEPGRAREAGARRNLRVELDELTGKTAP